MIFRVERAHVRNFRDARAAPRRPEVDQHDLAAVLAPVDGGSVQKEPFDAHLRADELGAAPVGVVGRRKRAQGRIFRFPEPIERFAFRRGGDLFIDAVELGGAVDKELQILVRGLPRRLLDERRAYFAQHNAVALIGRLNDRGADRRDLQRRHARNVRLRGRFLLFQERFDLFERALLNERVAIEHKIARRRVFVEIGRLDDLFINRDVRFRDLLHERVVLFPRRRLADVFAHRLLDLFAPVFVERRALAIRNIQ